MRAIVVLSGFCLLATASLHAQARYTVRVDDPATQILHVTAELP